MPLQTVPRASSLSGLLLGLLISLLFLPSFAQAACPPGISPADLSRSLGQAIGRLNRFFDRMQGTPSFNYDRMLYLLGDLDRREKLWSACGQGGSVAGQEFLLHDRIAVLEGEIVRSRSLPPGEEVPPRKAISEARRILSQIPVRSVMPPLKNPGKETPTTSSYPSRSLLFFLVLFLAGGGILLFVARRFHSGESRERAFPLPAFKRIGTQWRDSLKARSGILERMKERIGKGKSFVRIRAQLYLQDETTKEWRLSDEISQDDGGFLRSFGEEETKVEAVESFEEVSLGEGEVRTRLVIPMEEGDGPPAVLVVDALSSPRPVVDAPDPSGLLGPESFKERLFEISHRSPPAPASVLSLAFDSPDKRRILEERGEEAEKVRSFVVREVVRTIGPGTIVFGEPPGTFHVILAGKEERRSGALLPALSEGLGPAGGGELPETMERPWFRKVLVAHTRWRTPDSRDLDSFLKRIEGNMAKLRENPAIGTVNDA
ncbi:MAG: hypothetical protein ACP5OS_05060 [Leptospirillia bacterium]